MLATVADPRCRRGVRHRLAVILGLAVCAVLAGARSFTAIAEWAADADEQTLARLGVTGAVPSESTFRRTLQRLDADAFDDLAGSGRPSGPRPGRAGAAGRGGRQDLTRIRPWRQGGRHLLAAYDHAHGVVLGQVEVGAKTNEIPMFSALLDRMDIADAVITADALHAQREHATYLARRGAHYLLIVKRNQPSLHTQLAVLPWRDVPKADKAGNAATAAPNGAPSKSPRSPLAWLSPTPPRPSRSYAAARRKGRSGHAKPATRSPR